MTLPVATVKRQVLDVAGADALALLPSGLAQALLSSCDWGISPLAHALRQYSCDWGNGTAPAHALARPQVRHTLGFSHRCCGAMVMRA